MPFVPKVHGKEKTVNEKRNPEKDNVREENNVSLLQYTVCFIHFFALIFPLQGGNETKRTEQEGKRVSAPGLVWVLFCLTSPIFILLTFVLFFFTERRGNNRHSLFSLRNYL